MHARARVWAVLEVVVVFAAIVAVMAVLRASPLGAWQTRVLGRPLVSYLVLLLVGLGLMLLVRRDRGVYGIALADLPRDIRAATLGFLPVAAVAFALNRLNWKAWPGALAVSAVEVGAMVLLMWWLKRDLDRPSRWAPWLLAGGVALSAVLVAALSTAGNMLSALVFSFLFAGPAEELLFRGYIQSRLNEALGRPFRLLNAECGWGLVITAGLFGLWHVVGSFNPLVGQLGLEWPWGLWTFFAGLLFGLVRERTGGIVAPAILHGVLNFV